MARLPSDLDPMATDPGRWGHSLGNLAELLYACLDVAAPRSIVEVGAYAGDLTALLADWAASSDAAVHAIDPLPQPALTELAQARAELTLHVARSFEALGAIAPADAYVIDGDHNHHTVAGELARIAAATGGGALPLLLCHDVCWPHARRDSYYDPAAIPVEHRRPIAEGAYLHPGDAGTHEGGLIYRYPAATEGGPANGVLTAIEEFVAAREDEPALAIVPAFFGLGVVWSTTAPYADALAALLAPYDRNPVLARLEANRVWHLAGHEQERARAAWCAQRAGRTDAFLRRLLQSRWFGVASALTRLRERGDAAYGPAEVRALLGGDEPPGLDGSSPRRDRNSGGS